MFKTLIVVDNLHPDLTALPLNVIRFDEYLRDYPKRNEPKTRIINLCNTKHYLSKGYYCSLLAEAREHAVLPSVKVINELRYLDETRESVSRFRRELNSLESVSGDFMFYFGLSDDPRLEKLARKAFGYMPSPILKLSLEWVGKQANLLVSPFSFTDLSALERQQFISQLSEFTQRVWRVNAGKKATRWDMAILVDPEEKVPPSNKEAIARFIKAAAKHGIHAQALSLDDIQNITVFDALFIRQTTAIDHPTYRLAQQAENAGLVVIDDPASILRCCNKVYLHDAFTYQNVPSLRTQVISDREESTLTHLQNQFGYPMVLKMPEGSFSKGVFKVKDRQELDARLQALFTDSALVLAQEFLYTQFDWRIGVLNGRAIYACRYEMVRNHWQIYNHSGKRVASGGFETLPTFEVPRSVLEAALRACKIVGNGLYGVDVKEVEKKAFVLEVNDNPSIEHKVEDAYLGDELYMQVMGEFQRRLEARGR